MIRDKEYPENYEDFIAWFKTEEDCLEQCQQFKENTNKN